MHEKGLYAISGFRKRMLSGCIGTIVWTKATIEGVIEIGWICRVRDVGYIRTGLGK